jgi:hypothetical protein
MKSSPLPTTTPSASQTQAAASPGRSRATRPSIPSSMATPCPPMPLPTHPRQTLLTRTC